MSALDDAIKLAGYLARDCKNMTADELKEANARLKQLILQARREALTSMTDPTTAFLSGSKKSKPPR